MKLKDFLKKWAWQIFAALFLLLYLGKGCTSKKVSKTNELLESKTSELTTRVDSLSAEIKSLKDKSASSDDIKNEMERVMLDFLIYEDDLDKGKTSLSKIKDKIESND